MEALKTYLNTLSTDQKRLFAAECGTSINYLRKAISVGQVIGPELCVAIEENSNGAVSRQDLNPDNWQKIWPELRNSEDARLNNSGEIASSNAASVTKSESE
ncbi:TPA: transcriptional regulator [Yersinia enterocolitica]|uniref:transcriptional regulator n=1 Tax=Yersinia TaxID=629 RepID=UPI002881F3D5|nr:helix-turn-helix domain-containing protein [Yersinia enterocolitica]ELW8974599.1 helix-turn-helix domain-containing protein [Yersinia enterocolitica]HDL7808624.1 helix-turn-helix domain-containing protein [Yersinia enterocolitica]HDL8117408.1 helix-turn-helix domain-containing protein [Yersinia enterocolitica]HDL8138641.1 helix-turn-helix domain-containing protein [Yersinia enterocolitica]